MIKFNSDEHKHILNVMDRLPYTCWLDTVDGESGADFLCVLNRTQYELTELGIMIYSYGSWYMIPYDKEDLIEYAIKRDIEEEREW